MVDPCGLVYEFGPAIGIILFFLGRDAAREERMAEENKKLNSFIQNELIELVKRYGTQPEPKPPEDDQDHPVST